MIKNNKVIVQSVDRALSILQVFSNHEELGVTEISKLIGLNKSTTYGLLNTLFEKGYVDKRPNGKYCLGLKLLELGQHVQNRLDVRTVARPFLEELCEKYDETIHLVIFNRGEAYYVDKVESARSIVNITQVGKRVALHASSVGKAILAYMPEEQQEAELTKPLKQYTPNTITDPEKLREHIELVKEKGYALDMEEIELGVRCIGAPIRNYTGEVIGAFSCSAPSTRVSSEKLTEIIEAVKATALTISRNLGYKG
ncbi:MAG: IclR family transcriptional regulator, regulon repressor [Clostridia bacterium]|jgi:DNA-binding IclR family transcriptional regulator|nr:IclR family transcriptional regulator, regulon repressor [Clostridia bacterium]MDN5322715.1 IclR family transcriptional regulator, regulon repressor [Clostridia bacterium]